MARHRKLTQKFAGFPMFKLGTSGDTYPFTSPLTSEFVGLDGLSLDLQFAADKTLTARKGPTPTFTRASTATFVGSNGLIQSAGNNIARFDHDPVTLACKGLLIEESRTNLCLQSNAFSTSPWGNLNSVCAITQNETGVDGIANSAWTFTDDSITAIEGRFTTATLTSGVTYSYSIFVKKTTGTPTTYPAIWLARGGVFGGCVINTTAGTATPITALGAGTIISTTASVVDFGNFWRVTSFVTPTATGSWEITISPSGNGNGTGVVDGTTTGSAVFWGAQLEAGAFPTSYIPTTTASLARSADVCSITAPNFATFWNNNEGTVFASGDPRGSAAGSTLLMANSGANSNQIACDRTTTTIKFGVANSGSYTASIQQNSTNASFVKIAGSYATNDARSALNGTLGTPDTSVIVPTNLVRFNIGSAGLASQEFANGCISAIRYYKKSLSNAKLQAITT